MHKGQTLDGTGCRNDVQKSSVIKCKEPGATRQALWREGREKTRDGSQPPRGLHLLGRFGEWLRFLGICRGLAVVIAFGQERRQIFTVAFGCALGRLHIGCA